MMPRGSRPGRRRPRAAAILAFCAAMPFAPAAAAAASPPDDTLPRFVRMHLESGLPPYAGGDAKGRRVWSALQVFYGRREFRTAWSDVRAAELSQVLRRAAERGLDPAQYRLPRPSADEDDRARADVQLSFALARYASDLAEGRFDPRGATSYWALVPSTLDLPGFLEQTAAAAPLAQDLARLEPDHAAYRDLQTALARYRALAAAGGWPTMSAPSGLRRGARGSVVAALRRRLAASGDLNAPAAGVASDVDVFDAALDEALRRFERRHGLPADGVLDREALAALNVPVQTRVRQIELSLERWRWLPRPLGPRWIVVNIPTFMLHGYEAGRPTLAMRVVAGRTESPTPVFAQPMREVIFSPYWNVPPGIAANEIVPAVLRSPDYLARNGLELVRGSRVVSVRQLRGADWTRLGTDLEFRQRPGAGNSLGRVKFVLPNPFNVYLHDTPHGQLFLKARRDLSHGCMRVERPFELAKWVLASAPEWTPRAIRAAMTRGEERPVTLPEPLPVYVVYMTAWADPDGTVSFAPDLYGHDAVHEALLSRPPSGAPTPAAVVLASGDAER